MRLLTQLERWNRIHATELADDGFPMPQEMKRLGGAPEEFLPEERLDSWKQIAAHLKCSERTVRRWEQEGLPVHRHPHKKKAAIYAYKAEIDAWWRDGHERLKQIEDAEEEGRQPQPAAIRAPWWRRPWRLAALGAAALAVVAAGLMASRFSERIRGKSPTASIHSVAVLPLENLSHDPKQEYFADGMTDALITDLAKIRVLRVISRNSIMLYKGNPKPMPEVARELSVDAVVEGTVMCAGDRVRITAQLIEARKDRHLWGGVALASLVAAGVALFFTHPPQFYGARAHDAAMTAPYYAPIVLDKFSYFIRAVALCGGLVFVLFSWDESGDEHAAEYHACILLITAGAALTGAANELVTLFLALELVSIPTYLLLYLPRRSPATQEAATKYFYLSIFSSGLLLFGLAYLYGLTGITNLKALAYLSHYVPNVPQPQLALVAIDRMRLAEHDLAPAARLQEMEARRQAAIEIDHAEA